MHIETGTPWPWIRVMAETSVSADHAAEIAAPIFPVVDRRRSEAAGPHQRVVECDVRSSAAALLATGYVLPAAITQKPVVAARHELRPVFQGDSKCRLGRRP